MSFLLSVALLMSAETNGCSVSSNDGIAEYGHFYQLSFRDTGVNEEGHSTAEVKELSENEKKEAWLCLIQSANKKYCGAVALLGGCYKEGWQQDPFQCTKDLDLFRKYMELRNEVCPN
jgi:hypothetical protein